MGGGLWRCPWRPSAEKARFQACGEAEAAGDTGDDEGDGEGAEPPSDGGVGEGGVLALEGDDEVTAEVEEFAEQSEEGAVPVCCLVLGTGYGGRLSGEGRCGHDGRRTCWMVGCQGIFSRRWYEGIVPLPRSGLGMVTVSPSRGR